MELLVFAITVGLCLSEVNSNQFCTGTCYSGRLFPETKDISHGKHLKGFSYKNITTDNPRKCYSSCTQDCRCKACQMKDTRCELLDEDKTSKADSFVNGTGYVYYDLKQTMFKGQSHMLQPGVCHNDCCRSQPCLNGGTCTEHCQSPKEKFTCKCPSTFAGTVCQTRVHSCLDILVASTMFPKDGVYGIKRDDKSKTFSIYCSFIYPNQAWTLIESFSLEKNPNLFKRAPFFNEHTSSKDNPPSWSSYRVGLNRMQYIRFKSTLFRATCDFPNRNGTLTPDLLIGSLADTDIMTFKVTTQYTCKKFKFIDIRGHQCSNCTALTFQNYDGQNRHFYIDTTYDNWCQFVPPHTVESVDSFGYYGKTEQVSKCTASPKSTTQWWMGQEK